MKCPVCAAIDTKVLDSRTIKDNTEIRRRRVCAECAHRFTTYERSEGAYPMVVKKDGTRETWDSEKILQGVSKACDKRAIPVNRIKQIVDDIGKDIGNLGVEEISSQEIGKRVMATLRQLDEVAYVRFASVYKSFKDIDEFVDELSTIKSRK